MVISHVLISIRTNQPLPPKDKKPAPSAMSSQKKQLIAKLLLPLTVLFMTD